ncbi:DUF2269 family protein [Azospirillum brasilense]|uniref:DUF2269 family protein n=1 Tax=Azospirillum brasilense TaxID=192 RepID=UPI000E693745|nr:DUF2269 family protein [Azospirillum brasilense]NUB25951.1 DUF2269 family protein [Azospirillum brasilense]NUB32642.1 DUF2269 family protein [Azospirillum brasilense]RIW03579.1 DUF2269 family protein [Azospirillum brasilense]
MLEVLKVAHMVGMVVLGLGLAAMWVLDLIGRRARSPEESGAAARRSVLAYDLVVLPGVLLMLASGGGMIAGFYGSAFLDIPWLAGMVILFLLKFIKGYAITRLFFRHLRGGKVPGARRWPPNAREKLLSSFSHFLDIPVFVLIAYLGALKPTDWSSLIFGFALTIAAALTQTAFMRPISNT